MTGPLHWHRVWSGLLDRLHRRLASRVELAELLHSQGLDDAQFRAEVFAISRRVVRARTRARVALERWNHEQESSRK